MQLHEDARRALRESESVIRQLTRDRGYWVAADELSNMWFGNSFRPDPLVLRAVTINLGCAIDTLYERCEEEGLDPDRIRSLGDELSMATRCTGKDADSRRDLLYSTKAIIGAISREGRALLGRSNNSSDAAETWSVLWRKVLLEHNRQQECSVKMLQDRHLLGRYAQESFSERVSAYLNDCAESVGVSLAVVGVLPFSTTLKGDQVSELIRVLQHTDLLHTLSVRFRLADDLNFDPDEAINAGLMGFAAMTGTTLREARPQAGKHVDMINSKLRREWDRRSGPLIERLERIDKQYKETAIGPLLSQFVQSSDQIVQTISRGSTIHGCRPTIAACGARSKR
jgi:hypothetical protein